MQLFFDADIENNQYLNAIDSQHCIKVLRYKKGDLVNITDGNGFLFSCSIIDPNPRKCKLNIVDKKKHDQIAYKLHMAVAPTKNIDRFEWFLEKATELGVAQITPLLCSNSERKVIKPERLDKIITSACKQSIKYHKPKLNNLTKFNDFLEQNDCGSTYIAHCQQSYSSTGKMYLNSSYTIGNDACILIGPEGDFGIKELELAKIKGLKEITLSNSRLRTETAAVHACSTFNFINEMNK